MYPSSKELSLVSAVLAAPQAKSKGVVKGIVSALVVTVATLAAIGCRTTGDHSSAVQSNEGRHSLLFNDDLVGKDVWNALSDMRLAGVGAITYSLESDGAESLHLVSVDGFYIKCVKQDGVACTFNSGTGFGATCGSCGPALEDSFIHTARADFGFNMYLAARLNVNPARKQAIEGGIVLTTLSDARSSDNMLVCARNSLTGNRSCGFGRGTDLEALVRKTVLASQSGG